jgi:hypothetical protein
MLQSWAFILQIGFFVHVGFSILSELNFLWRESDFNQTDTLLTV